MRNINTIIIHCSGTPPDPHFGASQIDYYHRHTLHFLCIGYHYVIRTDGTIEQGRNLQSEGAHCQSHNKDSIGICYVGGTVDGKNRDTRTPEQKETLEKLVKDLLLKFPNAQVAGHNSFAAKDCPCFTVADWCRQIGLPEKNIYHG